MTGSRIFYGWIIVGLAFSLGMLAFGSRFTFGLFIPSITAALDTSVASVSLIFALFTLLSGLFQPVTGLLADRFGPRRVILVGLVLIGVALIGAGLARQVWHLLLFLSLLGGLGFSGVSFVITSALISRWFDHLRGRALGMVNSGNMLGQFLILPIAGALIFTLGWRWAFVVFGLSFFAMVPLVWRYLHNDPESIGLQPYGVTSASDGVLGASSDGPTGGGSDGASASSDGPTGVSDGASASSDGPTRALDGASGASGGPAGELDEASGREAGGLKRPGSDAAASSVPLALVIRDRSFWFLAISMFGCGFMMNMIFIHLPSIIIHLGYGPVLATAALTIMAGLGVAGVLATGTISDWFSRRVILSVLFMTRVVGTALLILIPGLFMIYAFAILFGLFARGTLVLASGITGDIFGRNSVAKVLGWIFLCHQVGGAMGTAIGGLTFDWTGSYVPALAIGIGVSALSAIMALLVSPRPHAHLGSVLAQYGHPARS